jgi:signal transduction histidine kinase
VIDSLFTNAVKFGAGKPIEISASRLGNRIRLFIQDHGIGISEALQKSLFLPFGRAVSALHYGGLGLGLYISRRIVEAHGGRLALESRPGEGAKFTLELPAS